MSSLASEDWQPKRTRALAAHHVPETDVIYWLDKLPSWLFEPSQKLAWADRHLATLREKVNQYLGPPEPYVITDVRDLAAGEHVLWIEVTTSPPPDLSLIAGDCVQNLRSSLEYFMQQLVLLSGGTPDRQTQFPIFETTSHFKIRGGDRMIKQLGTSAARDFVIGCQPEAFGLRHADPLLYLRDLSDGDKHRLLQPLALFCEHLPFGPNWRMPPDSNYRFSNGPYTVKTVFAHVPFSMVPEGEEVALTPQMTVALLHAEMHRDIVHRIGNMVGRVLGIFLDAKRQFP